MFSISLISATADPFTLAAAGRLHHGSFVEAVQLDGFAVLAVMLFISLVCAFVIVVSRFLLLRKKMRWLEHAFSKMNDSRNRYKSLVNSINDFVVIVDTEGHILYANPQSRNFTGHDSEDLIGTCVSVFLGMPESVGEGPECEGGFKVYNFFNNEFKMSGINGNRRWVSCKNMPLKSQDGSIDAFILIMRDISELKEKELELMAAKNLAEEGNRAKSAFLANMSHELRTPLSSILGYGQFLEMQKPGNLNEKQLKYISYIISSGEHLLEMVNDILDLSKIDAGRITIDKKPFDINMMLQRSPSTIKVIADRKKVEMVNNIQSNLGLLDADEVRVKQIIYNLLANAIKFTEPGRRVGIDACARGNTAIVSVWDKGCGIAPEDHERIFLPFEQAERHSRQGTGLGLSIVKNLVEMHGGSISVSSEPGMGSRFTVVLPGRIPRPEAAMHEPAVEMPPLDGTSSRTILVVDDNESVAALVSSVLESHGLQAIVVKNGEEALDYVGAGNYVDLILMDIGLPEISGTELLKKMKAIVNPDVPVIALTGYAMKGDRERFLNIGFDDYVSKPFKIDSLITKLRGSLLH